MTAFHVETFVRRTSSLAEAYRFFREHAGSVVGRSAAYAIALARAERAAEERGFSFEWEWDHVPLENENGEQEAAIGCVLRDERGRVLGSLWGIEASAPQSFIRLVEAELAHEADAAYMFPCSTSQARDGR